MTASRARIVTGFVLISVTLGSAASLPVRADTKSDLDAARARLAAVQEDLDRLAGQYADAVAELARIEDRIGGVQADVDDLRGQMHTISKDVDARIRAVYVSGTAETMQVLLTSNSLTEFADRVEFLGALAQADADLLLRARVTRERLRRREADLSRLQDRQRGTIEALNAQKAAIAESLAEAQALEARLEDRLAREKAAAAAARAAARRAASAPAPVHSGGALQVCPVGNPHSFSDDFGDPRPGGRAHQGIDLLAPLNTPVYAAQSGRFEANSNDLGGIAAFVYADNGDSTYYAHLNGYAGVGSGTHVGAGTVIGYVGNTGNAIGGPYHLHFEWHPGGGVAANPYSQLVPLC